VTNKTIVQITEPQLEFTQSEHAHPSFFAGLGAGKSEAATIRLVSLLQEDMGGAVAHYFPSYKLAKRRGLSGVQSYLKKMGYLYAVNKSDLTITIPALNDAVYYLDTYHDPDSIVSYEIAHAVIDELDTLNFENAEHAWRKINERIRLKTKHKCGNTLAVVSTTDQGKAGFCFKKWGYGENVDDGFHYITAGTGSNPFLPAGYVEQISKSYDPIMLEAMVNGGWVNFTANKIYHFYNKERHKSTRTIQKGDHLHIGLDFNVGGTCATVFVIDGDIVTAVDEFVSHDTQDFINNLTRFNTLDITIYPDASGNSNKTNAAESDIAMIRRAEWTVKHKATNPAVRDRINAFNGLLSHDRLKVNADKCPELVAALESQGYNDKGEPEKYTTHPAIDDWNDCAGYFIAYKFPIRIERPPPPQHAHKGHATSWQS